MWIRRVRDPAARSTISGRVRLTAPFGVAVFGLFWLCVITAAAAGEPQSVLDASLFLAEDDSWQLKYKPGSLRAKRLALYESMGAFTRA